MTRGETIRLWTVQPLSVWAALERRGRLHVDRRFYGREAGKPYVPEPYLWLVRELRVRVRGYQGRLPWWAYCRRPDLRWVRSGRRAGTRQVRLELELDTGRVCTFPIWAWDAVRCGEFLARSGRELARWEAAVERAGIHEDTWPLPQPFRARLERSWKRVFDSTLPRRGWSRSWRKSSDREAVFETLVLEDVRDVKLFTGSGRS